MPAKANAWAGRGGSHIVDKAQQPNGSRGRGASGSNGRATGTPRGRGATPTSPGTAAAAAPTLQVPSIAAEGNVSRDALLKMCQVLGRFRQQSDERRRAQAQRVSERQSQQPPTPPTQARPCPQSTPAAAVPPQHQPQPAQDSPAYARPGSRQGKQPVPAGNVADLLRGPKATATALVGGLPLPPASQQLSPQRPLPSGTRPRSDSASTGSDAGGRPAVHTEPLASVFGIGGSDGAWAPDPAAAAARSTTSPMSQTEPPPVPVFGAPIKATRSATPPLESAFAPKRPSPEPDTPLSDAARADSTVSYVGAGNEAAPVHDAEDQKRPNVNIFVVDNDLTAVWRSVVNPAHPEQAAANLARLLQMERAMQVAAEFLSMPGHVEVLRRVPEDVGGAGGKRARLAHHVLAALLRRLSPDFRTFAPCLVALATPDLGQEAVETAAAPETLGRLIATDLLSQAALERCLRVLLGDQSTESVGVQVLWSAARAFHAKRRRCRGDNGNDDSDSDDGTTSDDDDAVPGPPETPLLPYLEEVVWRHILPTSHVGLRLAKSFGWESRVPGGKTALHSVGNMLKPATRICVSAGAACSIDGVDRCAYSSAADTLFTVGGPTGIACYDVRTLHAGAHNDGVCKPRSLFSDKRFVAVDVGVKRDMLLAVTGPPDVPSVHTVDLKAMVKAGGPPAPGKPLSGVGGWQHSFGLIDADCATAIKSVGYRSAACCVAVKAENQFSLRLYTQSGVADRTITNAHLDFVTCLATSADNDNLLFSGARDGSLKCWDLRGNQAKGTALKGGHIATASSISVARDVVLTTGLDGRACLWDVRKLGQPIGQLSFDGPVLSCSTNAAKGLGVVATTHQLCVVSLHPFIVRDSVPGSYASATFGGPAGEAVFAVPMPPSITKGVLHGFRVNEKAALADW
eukprot:CAMPEP_0174831646 /NCGR_PEP_ID=MMETSP1114-20130205/3218_1 /TAXON_ID=312471 /ORGANISM="Neobodo designis, Strain CCAP 1951/1" /LENGTH=912 /DNA_ID=CAMNT_0016065477 /DNA_START=53 /DNA_END=2791 /DNA_ORIENTATION=+